MDFPTANITASEAVQRLLAMLKAQETVGEASTEEKVRDTLDITVARCIEHITARLVGNRDSDSETVIRDNLQSCFDLLGAEWKAGSMSFDLYSTLLARTALIRDLLSLADAIGSKSSSPTENGQ